MSIYGFAKGTDLEQMMKAMMQAEANGTMMYYALARMAREQGYDDIVDTFIEAANQEAVHAGFYATLVGKYPQNFWGLIRGLQKVEASGEAQLMALADKVRAAGCDEAADELEILAKYPQENQPVKAKKVYVCPVCGYAYEGDINAEGDDYVCPICGQPKSAFREAE